MEYADNGDLFQKITMAQKTNKMFPEPEIWKIFIQVVRGLKVLHDLRTLHRDMKVYTHNKNRVRIFFCLRTM